MTKLIVEMEMPQTCPCEFADYSSGIFRPCFAYYGVVERAVEFDECVRSGKRPDWCPIKGMLPEEHGDLIDADAIWERAGQKKGEADPLRLAAELCSSPVIIAAERKDNGNNS